MSIDRLADEWIESGVCIYIWLPGGSAVKNLPANAGTWVLSLDQKDPLEEGMATYSSILSWRKPWAEEPGRLVHKVTKSWTWLK